MAIYTRNELNNKVAEYIATRIADEKFLKFTHLIKILVQYIL